MIGACGCSRSKWGVIFKILFGIGFDLLWVAFAQALYIHQGIHGMKWGGSVSDYERLVKVHQNDLAVFYVKSNTLYYAANPRVFRVSYGFYRDQLYAAFIKLRSGDQLLKLAQTFTEKTS